MKILLIEDDPEVAAFLSEGLRHVHYLLDTAADGNSGSELALVNMYDVIILDYQLPGMSGLDVLKKIRKEGCTTKVLMLTAKDSIDDKVACLNAGADDYLVKPFAFAELLARLRVLMRRNYESDNEILKVSDLQLDLRTSYCVRGDKEITLTAQEFRLLEYLMRRVNEVVTRNELLELVWGKDEGVESNKIEVYIFYLRNKIDKGFDVPMLQTVRGRGYMLKHD